MKFKSYLLISFCLILAGCGNPSRKELSNILSQTESLAIFSAPNDCEAHFYPDSKFEWDNVWEGMAQGGARVNSKTENDGYIMDAWLLSAIQIFLCVPSEIISGGVSNAGQMPPQLKSRFTYLLSNAFEDQDPGDQVAQGIYTNCKEKNPELHSQRIYWSPRKCAEYKTASPTDKRAKMKQFCRTFDPGSTQMFLIVYGTDYGLAGGTTKDPSPCFFMTIQTELIRSKDGKRIYSREFEYKSASHGLKEWETDNGKLLKDQYSQACFVLGNRVSSTMLGLERIINKEVSIKLDTE